MRYRRAFPQLGLYTVGYFVILEAMLVAAILYWPEFDKNRGAIQLLASSIPVASELMELLGEGGKTFRANAYIAMQHFFKGCNTLGSAAAILFACGAVAGEAHRGTLEILLSRPIPRWRILLERYLAGVAAFAVPLLLCSLTIPWLAQRVDAEVAYRTVLLSSAHQIAFLSVVHALTFYLSARGDHPIRIALGVIFGGLFAFALYFVKLVSKYSPFRLADFDDHLRIFETRTLDWRLVAPMLVVTALLYAAAHRAFLRRLP